jgi:hypothetical protein
MDAPVRVIPYGMEVSRVKIKVRKAEKIQATTGHFMPS